tara:strand:- start:2889 stop:3152 length:264 start_codon:yes stop_codon:yes gene_type:complete
MKTLEWNEKDLKEITRLRLVSDVGHPCWDISYCWGIDTDGNKVRVILPFEQVRKGKGNIHKTIIEHAKKDKVFAKGLNIFNVISCFQ